ncbi:hypothetical protein [Celeribacter naphthalenivorans]|uniref:hypothetical protein n=1 Tax=Celeribacter naphthalenivorans TaxID=1614694 RepID=UPI001CFAD237|nr:hypothetical protein [Celeribacter naphthalenivorans]
MNIEIPGVGVVEFPDDMPMEQIEAALSQYRAPDTRNADGTYGTPPEGMVMNPKTGQMEDMRSPANPNIPTGTANAAMIGAGQGLGFGMLDEAVAGGRALMGNDYDYELAVMREADRRAQDDNAVAYYSGMIPGAVASSVSGWKAAGVPMQGKNLMGTAARGAGMGAVEGGLFGFGQGEGAADRVGDAAKMAATGGAIGGMAPPVVHGASKALGAGRDVVTGGVDAALGRANQSKAGRVVLDTVRKSGRSVADVQDDVARAIAQGQPEFRMMDALGTAGQRRASGIARSGGDGAEDIARFLQQRQLDQPNRVAGFVEDAFTGTTNPQNLPVQPGSIPEILTRRQTAQQAKDALTAARGQAADVAYDAARQGSGPVDVRGALSVIDDRIGGMRGSNVTGDGIDGALAKFRSRLAADPAPNGEIARELSDFDRVLGVKQDVQDAIGVAVRAGRNNEARELTKLSQALDQALESASDGYRAANDSFRQASQTIGAVDQGAAMSRPSARAADTIPQFQAMTPDQQAAARVGYGDRALAKIEASTSPTANRAKAFTSTKAAQEADAMAVDPRLFRDRIARENAMWDTQNRALGGSRTADNLEDIRDLGPMQNIFRALRDVGNLELGSAVQNVGAAVGPIATGQNEATRSLIAKMLMSGNPEQALQKALREEAMSQGQKRVAEALMRSIGREAVPVR